MGISGEKAYRPLVKHYPLSNRPLPDFLDTHQVEGVKWILTRSRAYLAHAPGAGKTLQALIGAMWAEGAGQSVFVVPPSLTVNWVREITKFYARLRPYSWAPIAVVPISARREFTGWKAQFLIVPDSMLTKPWVLEKLTQMPIKFLAVDEASRFKEPTSQRTIALFGGRLKNRIKSPGLIRNTRHAILMDGSPTPNGRAMELWAPTFALAPEAISYMNREEYGRRYCNPTTKYVPYKNVNVTEYRGTSHHEELKSKLQRDFMHVVTESDLDHPERRRSMLIMNQDVRSSAHKSWEKKHLSNVNLSDIKEDASQGDLARFRHELGISKTPWVASYVRDRLEEKNESILLFAWHRDVCELLARKLSDFKPGLIIGGVNKEYVKRQMDLFQDGKRKLLVLNIEAGGRGFNLQRADRVIFAEYSWTDETNKQAEKRASRKGNEKLFTRCEYIVSPNSMDEVVLQSVFRKAENVKRVIG